MVTKVADYNRSLDPSWKAGDSGDPSASASNYWEPRRRGNPRRNL